MHVLAAPDKFKGSLTAREVAERIAAGIQAETPQVPVVLAPVADGGDGTVDAALAAGFERVQVRAEGPTGEPVDTAFAAREGVAVVEMADVSGLRRLPKAGSRRWRPVRTAPARSCGPHWTTDVTRSCSASEEAPAPTEAPGWCRRWGAVCSTRPVKNFPAAGGAGPSGSG